MNQINKKMKITVLVISCIIFIIIGLIISLIYNQNSQKTKISLQTLNTTKTVIQNQQNQTVFDTILSTCPTQSEIKEFNNYFPITSDIPLKDYKCSNGLNPNYSENDSDNLDPRLTIYNSLRIMKAMHFREKLPWTEKNTYDWFKEKIKGININSKTNISFCCNPKQIINLKLDVLQNKDKKEWVKRQTGTGMMHLLLLEIHEARHIDILHTCGYKDHNLNEMGAWAVQYYLGQYIATELPNNCQNQYERDITLSSSEEIKKTRFCDYN